MISLDKKFEVAMFTNYKDKKCDA